MTSLDGQFICALWSDSIRWESHVLPDLTRSMRRARRGEHGLSGHGLIRKLGATVYCFDDRAYEAANRADVKCERIVDPRTYEPWQDVQDLSLLPGGQFVRKFLALRKALESTCDAVLLDIDMILVGQLPTDYWEQVRGGASIQVPLTRLKRRKSAWRALGDNGDSLPRHFSTNASCIYARGVPVVDRAIQLMDQNSGWYEEHALAFLIDELMGGWQGPEEYAARGHQPPGTWLFKGYHNSANPWFVHLRR